MWIPINWEAGDGHMFQVIPPLNYKKIIGILFSDENGGESTYYSSRLHQYYWQIINSKPYIFREKDDLDGVKVIMFVVI